MIFSNKRSREEGRVRMGGERPGVVDEKREESLKNEVKGEAERHLIFQKKASQSL